MSGPTVVCVLGQSVCPHDPDYVHENVMGPVCVPRRFSFRTGRASGIRQTQVGGRWWFPGGCDAHHALDHHRALMAVHGLWHAAPVPGCRFCHPGIVLVMSPMSPPVASTMTRANDA